MANHTRKSHSTPEFYLAGFTPSGTKDDRLWVHDKETGKAWPARPRSVGFEVDLYRVESPALRPDHVENWIADKIDGPAAAAIRRTEEAGMPPSGDDLEALLHFAALMRIRVPGPLRHLTRQLADVGKDVLRAYTSDRTRYQAVIAEMKAAGVKMSRRHSSYESMKQFVTEDQYELRLSQNWVLDIMVNGAATVLELLRDRTWHLLVAEPNAGEFVTSDNPFLLYWYDPPKGGFPPGLAMKGTEVCLPLTRRIALVGRFEEASLTIPAARRVIETRNALSLSRAYRQVYSPHEAFPARPLGAE